MVVTKQNLKNQTTQRSECHKMMCRNCSTRFCFKCLAILTTDYTCGCTRDLHGFIDPHTGKRLVHLRSKKKKSGKPVGKGGNVKEKHTGRPAAKGRGRGGKGKRGTRAGA